jgi:hypothetical protein
MKAARCLYCAELMQPEASVCKHCGRPRAGLSVENVLRRFERGQYRTPARILAAVCVVAVLGFVLIKHRPPAEEKAPTADEQEAANAAEEQRAKELADQQQAAEDWKSPEREAERREKAIETMRALFVTFSPAERRKTIDRACATGAPCDEIQIQGVIRAAADVRERNALDAAAVRARAAWTASVAAATRKQQAAAAAAERAAPAMARAKAAEDLDRALLDQHLNPDGVTADGMTLRIQIWSCSRQFLDDLAHEGDMLRRLRDLGFKQIACSNGLVNGSLDL